MTPAWFLLSLLGPALTAAAAAILLRSHEPSPHAVILLNAVMPGSGLAAHGRPLLEVVLCVLFATASLLIIGGVDEIQLWIPIMFIGGFWGMLHTPLSPLAASRRPATTPAPVSTSHADAAAAGRPRSVTPGKASERIADDEVGYAVLVRCTECGADVEVPVLQHMAHCQFCGSEHLVIGHDETLAVAVPDRIGGHDDLRDTILDHYRYQHYLKLYARHVAPLERSATQAGPYGGIAVRPDVAAAAAAAEEAVSRRADAFRRRLASGLSIVRFTRFLAPYRHGVGTLYQAAFGRTKRDKEKALRFAIGSVEGSIIATSGLSLPAMGKLSYLRALVPAAQVGEGIKSLPLDRDPSTLNTAYGVLERKNLVRDIDVIRLGSRFSEEVTAVVWRPWWIAEVKAAGIHETLLVDGGGASVSGPAPTFDAGLLAELPQEAREPGAGLRFSPMECPTCGQEFTFDVSAVVHFCHNCHRCFEVADGAKVEVGYDHAQPPAGGGHDFVPFWRFPLRLRVADGRTVTDLMHLKDGIDGTLDQIGDGARAARHAILVPAFRCVNSRLTADAVNRLFVFALRARQPLTSGRFPLDVRHRPWTVSLDAGEAQRLAPLCLVNVFTPRDIARVNVHQVKASLFEARLVSSGRLCYLPVPEQITGPFRPYLGKSRSSALERAQG